jgi:uncharacterized phage protein (TIGR01671 family)
MAREIRFRAWSGVEMIKVDVLAVSPVMWDSSGTGVSLVYQPHIIVMQFTGLKDKNGQDIYEGDIVYNENCFGCVSRWGDGADNFPDRRIVVWDALDVRFGWEFIEEKIKGRGCSGYCLCEGSAYLFEVIGNIYENPELLAKQLTPSPE